MGNSLKGTLVDPEKIYGKSAYEIAVMHGFDGTEEEWIRAVEAARVDAENARDSAEQAAKEAEEALDEAGETIKSLQKVDEDILKNVNDVKNGKSGIIRKGNGANSVILNNPDSNTADGDNSIVVGTNCHADALNTFCFGKDSYVTDNRSGSAGQNNRSQGLRTFTFGEGLISCKNSGQKGQVVVGRYNVLNPDAIFIVGDGADDKNRHNALEVIPKDNAFLCELILGSVTVSASRFNAINRNIDKLIRLDEEKINAYDERILTLEAKVAKLEAKVQSLGGVTLITFTFDGQECQAVQGMTFGEWIDSEYNTVGARRDGNSVMTDDEYGWMLDITVDTVIEDGEVYYAE